MCAFPLTSVQTSFVSFAVKQLERERDRAKKGKEGGAKEDRDDSEAADLQALAAQAQGKEDPYAFKIDDR